MLFQRVTEKRQRIEVTHHSVRGNVHVQWFCQRSGGLSFLQWPNSTSRCSELTTEAPHVEKTKWMFKRCCQGDREQMLCVMYQNISHLTGVLSAFGRSQSLSSAFTQACVSCACSPIHAGLSCVACWGLAVPDAAAESCIVWIFDILILHSLPYTGWISVMCVMHLAALGHWVACIGYTLNNWGLIIDHSITTDET